MREFKIDWLVCDWVFWWGETNFEWIKLGLCQDLIGLNELVSENFTQLYLFVWPRKRTLFKTRLWCLFESLNHLTWNIRNVLCREAIRSSTSDSSLFDKLFITAIPDSKRMNSCSVTWLTCLRDDLVFVLNFTISKEEKSSLLVTDD